MMNTSSSTESVKIQVVGAPNSISSQDEGEVAISQLGQPNVGADQKQMTAYMSANIEKQLFNFNRSKKMTRDACFDGLAGSFMPMKHDFSPYQYNDQDDDGVEPQGIITDRTKQHFEEKPQCSRERLERVKKIRFLICFLGLFGLASSQLSRTILNVAIADMTELPSPQTLAAAATIETASGSGQPIKVQEFDLEKGANTTTKTTVSPQTIEDENYLLTSVATNLELDETANSSSTPAYETSVVSADQEVEDSSAGLRFDWSSEAKNFLLSSFYIGYAPCMLFGGKLAEKHGSKYLLFVCVFGTSIINILTPTIACYSFSLLITSRITLGILQGGLVPASYDLFNKWLTLTETSIFAPMIKVSLALGTFSGSLLPGLTAYLGYQWTVSFYIASALCGIWSLFWFSLATSTPQTNSLVTPNELNRIMKKKRRPMTNGPIGVSVIANGQSIQLQEQTIDRSNNGMRRTLIGVITEKPNSNRSQNLKEQVPQQTQPQTQSHATPWLLILKNPSVLALTFVKLTYNIGLDFLNLELSTYLRDIHKAPTEMISAILGGGCFIQMALITLVAWLAGVLVHKGTFGLSRTKWRKIFQGFSNFAMAIVYFALPAAGDNLNLITFFVLLVFFFWIFAAGGESMVPYDLSSKYPATIVGIAHSVSILSGLVTPLACSLVLGDETKNPVRWNYVFIIVGSSLTVGGLVFTLVHKSKPFLPEELVATVPSKSYNCGNKAQDKRLVMESISHNHHHQHNNNHNQWQH